MGISQKLGLAGGLLWARLHRVMRVETWGLAKQDGAMKPVQVASFRASLLSALAGCVLLLAAQAGLAASTQIAGGSHHTVALKPDGNLWTWGGNEFGQLGDGTTTQQSSPVQIGTGYISVETSGNAHFNAALKADGSLWEWGRNNYGQIGDGTTTNRLSPVQIGTDFSAVAVGGNHVVALKTDGSLWAWGRNSYGQLGDGTTTDRLNPVQIGTGYSAVAAGEDYTAALKTDGSLWTWGLNYYGQLGDGTTTNRLAPVQIGIGYSAVVAWNAQTFAFKTDGSLWAWGFNIKGALGDGTTINRLTPIQVGTGYSAVAGGDYHAAALKTDGSLWTWGGNSYGQLGDGTIVTRTVPAQIGIGYSIIASGGSTLYAGKNDGSLWAWGQNGNGQLGDGTTTDRHIPTLINFTLAVPDTTAPTVPTGLTATAPGANQVNLNWTASTDNVGVTAYKLYRGGALLTTLGDVTSYSDTGLAAATTYSYAVSACDTVGNCSAQNAAITATTGASAASLVGLTLSCPSTIGSGGSAACTANGSYSDGSGKSVTAAWTSSNTAAATINASGQITAAGVTADTPVTISASYSESGVTKTANATVTITVAAAQATNDCSGTGKYLTGITIAGGAAKKVGDTLDVNYCLKNFSKISRFDIYVAVKVPDNSLLYMKSAGFFGSPIFNSSVRPYLKNTLLPDVSGPVLSMPELPLELPLGSYTFYVVPVLTGKSVENTANWIGQISQGTFTLSW